MKKDMTVPCADGLINIRVGAIIMKDGKFLMAGSDVHPEYLYSVGGRVQFGETAQQAVIREVEEETGIHLEIDRLGFVHENYFYGDLPANEYKLIYELSFYFYMKTPQDFEPVNMEFTEGKTDAYLRWISPDEPMLYYPQFFRTELLHTVDYVKHIVTDER